MPASPGPAPGESNRRSAYVTDYHTVEDFLNFSDFQPALAEILRDAATPLTVGVFGAWGSGKTSLLRMLRQEMDRGNLLEIRTVWFTAWKYDRHEALWRAFTLRVLDALYPRADGAGPRESRPRLAYEQLTVAQQKQVEQLDRLQASVYRAVDWQEMGRLTVDWLTLLREGSEGALELASAFLPVFLPISGTVTSALKTLIGKKGADSDQLGVAGGIRREIHEFHREQLTFMEQFESAFAAALKLVLGDRGRLIVFVDDLDRCLPEKAVEVLEAIKLFLEVPGTVFVLGMDREVITQGVEARYGALFREARAADRDLPISGDTYLQKIVQIPFHLPPLAVEDLEHYLQKLEAGQPASRLLSERTLAVFARGLYANPRQVKRALNIFRLLQAIATQRERRDALPPDTVAWPLLAKTIVIQLQYPELYGAWRRYPTLVQTLEAEFTSRPSSEEEAVRGRVEQPDGVDDADGAAQPTRVAATDGGLLGPYLQDRQRYLLLEQMLRYPERDDPRTPRERARFAGLSREQMRAYLRLAGTVESDGAGELPPAPADLMAELLSGDRARVLDAVERLRSDAEPPQQEAARRQLVKEMVNPQHYGKTRAGAGYAPGLLGDPRAGVGVKDGLPHIEWVTVEAGPFTMGSDPAKDSAADEDEQPQFTCDLIRQPYRISRYPVTVAQYARFVQDGGYAQEEYWTASGWQWRTENDVQGPEAYGEVFQTPNHPQVGVSWYEAVAFCNWLSQRLDQRVMLPSEAQWERAARGTDGRIYPWGDEFDTEYCNMKETGVGATAAVGCFPQGDAPCGAADMAGNVWEWCATKWVDSYENYTEGVNDDPVGTGRRVVRGGSFDLSVYYVRCAVRLRFDVEYRNDLGFRVASPGR